ncbi:MULTISPECIES: mersacidin family lantibiotic [Exiguobacterium]|uniref:Mersacidin family lantibiotic n=1 Tax=Exiguobacterium indicum TaxID=296995 RepID=A0ABU8EM33_9BACL|nr:MULTISPECIES: mersacidin family lantibiotic [unclassified Exiguobacterium]
MTNEQIIQSWKNLDETSVIANPAGEAVNELNFEEMSRINGGGDVQPETTPFCVGVIVGVTISLSKCK